MFSLNALAKNLSENQDTDSREFIILLHQLVEAVKLPGDISCLIGPIVKLLPNHNIYIKRTIYSVLPRVCETHPEAALLVVNTILQDSKDPNPVVKCLAVSTLCSLPTLLKEYAGNILLSALEDGNPRVRRTAVQSCGKVFRTQPDVLNDCGLINRLYESIRDPDPVVVTNCLLVLDTILASEGGIVVNQNMAKYLLSRLSDFPDAQLATILQVLGKHEPNKDQDLFQELSILDPYLVHKTSSAVVVNCIKLFLCLTHKKYPHLLQDILKRVTPVLKTYMSNTLQNDTVNFVLDFLIEMKNSKHFEWLYAFSDSPSLFYPNLSPVNLSVATKQLALLQYMCTDTNYEEVLNVLKERYCNQIALSHEAVDCVCAISLLLPTATTECRKILISLLDSKDDLIVNHVSEALQGLNLHEFELSEAQTIFDKMYKRIDLSNPKSIPPVFFLLLNEFGQYFNQTPYILEVLAKNFQNCKCTKVKYLILTISLKMFLRLPAKCQHSFGEILEKCITEDSDNLCLELQEKAKFYYDLLEKDIDLTKKLVLGE